MMKKTLFCLTMWLIVSGMVVQAEQKIVLGYVDFPPYEYEAENHQPTGILVEIVTTLFARAQIPVELRFLPFKRAYSEAETGRIDGLFNFYKTEERLRSFDYSAPLIENPLILFVRKDSVLNFERLEDLKGLRVGGMLGYTYGPAFDNATSFIIERISSHESNFKKLVYGRIDAYPCDRIVGIYVALKEKVMSEVKILPTPLNVMEGHIGFTKGKHAKVIAKINAEIEKMRQSGEIKTIIDKFFTQ